MLPKTGVFSLPDFRVTAFLKLLEDLAKDLTFEKNYMELQKVNTKFKAIARIELRR